MQTPRRMQTPRVSHMRATRTADVRICGKQTPTRHFGPDLRSADAQVEERRRQRAHGTQCARGWHAWLHSAGGGRQSGLTARSWTRCGTQRSTAQLSTTHRSTAERRTAAQSAAHLASARSWTRFGTHTGICRRSRPSAALRNTAPRNAAPQSTARHHTAPHSTALQHGTAPHSTSGVCHRSL